MDQREVEEAWERYRERAPGNVPREVIRSPVIPRPRPGVLEELRRFAGVTATVSDILDSLGVAGTVPAGLLKPVCPGKSVAGPAITVRYIPEQRTATYGQFRSMTGKLGDRDAYALAQEGDIVVMDNGGRHWVSTMGGLSTLSAIRAGVAACIVDGGVRDVDAMRAEGLPVWSRGVTPLTGKLRVEAVEINGPVTCGGIRVNPGDVVMADDTGVVNIPLDLVKEVLAILKDLSRKEEALVKALKEGLGMEGLRTIMPPEKW